MRGDWRRRRAALLLAAVGAVGILGFTQGNAATNCTYTDQPPSTMPDPAFTGDPNNPVDGRPAQPADTWALPTGGADGSANENSGTLVASVMPDAAPDNVETLGYFPERAGNDAVGWWYTGANSGYAHPPAGTTIIGATGVCLVGAAGTGPVVVELGGHATGAMPPFLFDYVFVQAGGRCVAIEADGHSLVRTEDSNAECNFANMDPDP